MGKLGALLLLAAVAAGLGFVGNHATRLAIQRCLAECPKKPDALKEVYIIGPFQLQICDCGPMHKHAHGEDF